MKLPTIKGVIKRRILLNYRIDPDIVQEVLPHNFRPKLVNGYAIAGICLIRLEEIRPKILPAIVGISSENSAHRIAVEWDNKDGLQGEGVFVPRRDTNSRINALTGGRIFSGVHHHSKFTIADQSGEISVCVNSKYNKSPLLDLKVRETHTLPEKSVFNSLEESSKFFEAGCIGYSPRPNSCTLDGLLLEVNDWQVTPLSIDYAKSSYFDDRNLFPPNSIQLDHALLMRDIPHLWHSVQNMTAQ